MSENASPVTAEAAFVLLADVVAYSLLSIEDQLRASETLKQAVQRMSPTLKAETSTLLRDTGDGLAMVFLENGADPFQVALDLAEECANAALPVRIGLHFGPIARRVDVNGELNVSGPAINGAERVMSCGDAGHVLVSSTAAEFGRAKERWRDGFQFLGKCTVKHGETVELYGLRGGHGAPIEVPSRVLYQSQRDRPANNNFSEPDRAFVGREGELDKLRHQLSANHVRLVTITGPGGIGKSRLALEVARQIAHDYADGAWLVQCDNLANLEDLRSEIARVLGLNETGSNGAGFLSGLAERQLLLILDCFERILDSAPLVEEILSKCREIKVVVTSRKLLGLPRETEFVLGPMSMHRTSTSSADAVTLFYDSAESSGHPLSRSRRVLGLVQEIVELLQGMPLAIVLASGRLRHMSLAELHEQVRTRPLGVLKRRAVGKDRHSSLAVVVADSFDLIREELRSLLIRLSIFRGGFTLNDAQAVISPSSDVLDDVAELRDNSLLSTQEVDSEMRYRLLDVVGEYIDSVAEESLLEPVRASHSKYFAELAVGVRNSYDAGNWKAASAQISKNLGNYRRAIQYAIKSEQVDLIRRFALTLARPFMEAGFRADFYLLADALLSRSQDMDLDAQIEVIGLRGGIHRRDNNFRSAESDWLLKTRLCAEAGKSEVEADTWNDLANLALSEGDLQKAQTYVQRFQAMETTVSNPWVRASGSLIAANLAMRLGNTEKAEELTNSAEDGVEGELPRTESFFVWMTATDLRTSLGDASKAERICLKAIRESVVSRHYTYTGSLVCRLVKALDAQGDIEGAALAIATAGLVPKSTSPSVREQYRSLRAEHCRKYGESPLDTCENTVLGLEWQRAALDLVDRCESRAMLAQQ